MDGRTAWLVPFQPQIPMGILDKAANMIHALLVLGCWKAVAGIVPATWNTELWTHGWRFSDVLGSLINPCNWQLWDPQRTLNTLNHQPLATGSEFLRYIWYQWPATVYSHPRVTHFWIRDEGPVVGPRNQEEDAHERDSIGSAQWGAWQQLLDFQAARGFWFLVPRNVGGIYLDKLQ